MGKILGLLLANRFLVVFGYFYFQFFSGLVGENEALYIFMTSYKSNGIKFIAVFYTFCLPLGHHTSQNPILAKSHRKLVSL